MSAGPFYALCLLYAAALAMCAWLTWKLAARFGDGDGYGPTLALIFVLGLPALGAFLGAGIALGTLAEKVR